MKRVGILGGTFDPVHCGHMIIARAALEQFSLDRVLIMTGGNPPHKMDRRITPAAARHEMVKLAAENEKGIEPFDFELNRNEPTYTVNTLRELKRKYPDTEFFFIIGEDSLLDLPKWYKPREIMELCRILVYPRGSRGSLAELVQLRRREFGDRFMILDSPVIGISSTYLRERISMGRSIRYFVPDRVLAYIEENKVYG